MKQILVSIAALIVLIPSVSGGQVLPYTHYTPENEVNPLPSAEVLQVYQDRQGFMWFAIYTSGLVRYDGVNMQIYGLEHGLTDLTVWDMIEDSDGRLWVSSNAGVVVSERPLEDYNVGEDIEFTREVQGKQLVNVAVNHNRMAAGKDGVWIGTEGLGLVRYSFTGDGVFQADTLSTSAEDAGSEQLVRSLVVEVMNQFGYRWEAAIFLNL